MDYKRFPSAFRSFTGASVSQLGTNTEFAANFEVLGEFGDSIACTLDLDSGELVPVDRTEIDLRRVRYRLQRVAHNVLGYKHRVGFCHRGLGFNSAGAHIRGKKGRYSLGGLAVCANSWVCPVCASRIARRRSDEVRQVILKAQRENLCVEMVTFTVPHGLGDSAKYLADSVASAWRKLTAHGSWKRPGGPRSLPGIKKRVNVRGYVRALEVTHGSSGWHPHLHIIFISEFSLMPHRVRLWELWSSVCTGLGLGAPSLKRGVDIQNGEQAGEYICKFSDDSELLKTKQGDPIKWDAADELTLANRKSGRNGSRKPHQILADAETNHESILLFREFAKAFKGKSQLQWSPNLKTWAGVGDLSDEEIAEQESESDFIFMIPSDYWNILIKTSARKDRRSTLIRLAETGGVSAVARFISPLVSDSIEVIEDRIAYASWLHLNPDG